MNKTSNVMYFLLDPINDMNSGITVYSEMMKSFINKYLGIQCTLISRKKGVDIDTFYKNACDSIINDYLRNTDSQVIIELPDTYCYLANYLNKHKDKIAIHVRLHGLDAIIRKFQTTTYSKKRLRKELEFMSTAEIISAPSNVIYEETSKFINIDDCYIYPNPIPSHQPSEKKIDFLFLGKFTYLKGAQIINKLSKHISIHVYSPNKPSNNKLIWIDPTKFSKKDILSKSRYVIIPSLFESFSLVLYEALSYDCKVICSNCIPFPATGTNIKPSVIHTKATLKNILKAIELAQKSCDTFDYDLLYKDFLLAIKQSLTKIISKHLVETRNKRNIKFKYTLELNIMNTFTKKIKKLLRNPKQFFIDSKLYKFVSNSSCEATDKSQTNTTSVNEELQNLTKINKTNIASFVPVNQTKQNENKVNAKETNPINKQTIKPKEKSNSMSFFEISSSPLSTEITVNYKNLLKSNLSKDNLLIINDENNTTKFIIENIEWFNEEKVTQFKEKNLKLISYKNNKLSNSSSEIANKFPIELKEYFGSFKFILCSNPQSHYITAIRFSSAKIRTICLINKFESLPYISDKYTDCLIIDESLISHVQNIDKFRYVECINFNNSKEIADIIKNVLREFSSKDYNLFLPIYISEEINNYLIDPDLYESYSIIIDVLFSSKKANNFKQLIDSSTINALLIREELFFRYKNLIKVAQINKDYKELLKIMLQDGYKVHEKN